MQGDSGEAFASSAKSAKAEKPATEKLSSLPSELTKGTADPGDEKLTGGRSSSKGQKAGAKDRALAEEIRGDSVASNKSDLDASSKADTPFKRHDHAKYMEKIKNKAIDWLNKEKDVSYARLCKDSTTDEWSLWIYRTEGKAYRFVTYVWDEVDEKWKESFKSDKLPISGWQHHLRFSTGGKDCRVLKEKRH